MKDLKFAERLRRACDDVPEILPEMYKGRLVVLAKQLGMSEEGVRRWYVGDARPRVKMMKKLADFLQTDEVWLSLGVASPARPEISRISRAASGASHLALGLAMTEGGGTCAIPTESDPRKKFVDFYMTKDEKLSAFRAALGLKVKPGEYEFIVPHEYEQVRNVGFVDAHRGFAYMKVVDLAHHLIARHKERKGGDYAITVKEKSDHFVTGRDVWPKVSSFGELV